MFSFYKKKNFRKIYILLGISITLFLCLFLNQNLSIKNVAVNTNKDLFSRKLLDDYNSFFEIKKITLNGRSKSNPSIAVNLYDLNAIIPLKKLVLMLTRKSAGTEIRPLLSTLYVYCDKNN